MRRARPDSGQDAYFAARVGKDTNVTAFGIADGVGGWTEHGIDPADFSHGLCSYMAQTALDWSDGKLGPRELLHRGYDAVLADRNIRGGGSTACVAVVEENGRMHVANLGDSGFLQLRLGSVHHSSNPQTHAFNTPYQLSLTPPEVLAQAAIFGGLPLNDQPDRADVADHMLRHGDVLVLATDGVWDNLDSQDVLRIVSEQMRRAGAWQTSPGRGYVVSERIGELVRTPPSSLWASAPAAGQQRRLSVTLQGVIAAAIVGEAKTCSMDRKRDGPFAKAVRKEYPSDPYHGGKVDDISALVIIPIDHSRTAPQQLKAKL